VSVEDDESAIGALFERWQEARSSRHRKQQSIAQPSKEGEEERETDAILGDVQAFLVE